MADADTQSEQVAELPFERGDVGVAVLRPCPAACRLTRLRGRKSRCCSPAGQYATCTTPLARCHMADDDHMQRGWRKANLICKVYGDGDGDGDLELPADVAAQFGR